MRHVFGCLKQYHTYSVHQQQLAVYRVGADHHRTLDRRGFTG